MTSEEMLKLFEEHTSSLAQGESSPAMTPNLPSPTQAASPSLPEQHQQQQQSVHQNLINTLLQQAIPVSLNSTAADCTGFTGTASQLLTLLKPPDVTTVTSTPLQTLSNSLQAQSNNLQTINITDSNLADVIQLLSNQQEIRKNAVITEAMPLATTVSFSGNTSSTNPTSSAERFTTSPGIMVTSGGFQTTCNSFSTNMTTDSTPVTLSNTGLINVISGGISIPVKLTNVLTEAQQIHPDSTHTQSMVQNSASTMSTSIGSIISSSIVTPSSPGSNQTTSQHQRQHQADLPADLANVNLQMFPPVSSLQSGNMGPQSVLVSVTNRQTNPPAAFNPGPFSVNATSNNTSFLNVEIPEQPQVEVRDILETKPKLTLVTSVARSEQQHSMLRQMLTNTNDMDSSSLSPSPVSSPGENIPESVSSISSPNSVFHDPVSQLTLITKSEDLHIDCNDDDAVTGLWDISCFKTDPVELDVPSKVQKSKEDSDAHSDVQSEISVEKLFDAGGADSTMDFKFNKFGQDNQTLFTFGSAKPVSSSPATPDVRSPAETGTIKSMAPPIHKPHGRKVKDTGLGVQFPSRTPSYELKIVSQPEEQHRARYLTEGSRGAVKDRSQQSHPVVKLIGHSDVVNLQVFVGNETGKVKPHGFYQACKVCGKNSTPSVEKEIDGTIVIETEMSPTNDMVVSVDCVGILKLRNADVEKRIGLAKARAKKKNSTRARLIFRVTFQKPDGNYQTLQVASSPIICTQPVGQPEISRMSLEEAQVTGGQDLFIIGKNFLKGTQVKFQEVSTEDGATLWEKEADIDQEFFQQTHLICKVPEYRSTTIGKTVLVQIIILCRGKVSESQQFCYLPHCRTRG